MLFHPEIGVSGKDIDMPLHPGKKFIIGSSESGVKPWEFKSGTEGEIGYLKLYLTNQPISFHHLAQESPFKGAGSREFVESVEPKVDLCGTRTIIIRQLKKKSGAK